MNRRLGRYLRGELTTFTWHSKNHRFQFRIIGRYLSGSKHVERGIELGDHDVSATGDGQCGIKWFQEAWHNPVEQLY
jgi:hypothetical protein